MNNIEKIYTENMSKLLNGIENISIPKANPIMLKTLNTLDINVYAKLATVAIDVAMRYLSEIARAKVSSKEILIGDLISAYFYQNASKTYDLNFLEKMTVAISQQNELKQELKDDLSASENINIIKKIDSIFLIEFLKYYNVDIELQPLIDEIYNFYHIEGAQLT